MDRISYIANKSAQPFLFLMIFGTSTFLRAQSIQLSDNVDHVSGVISAYRDCLEAWQFGDVLLELTESGTGRMVDMTSGYYSEGPEALSVIVETTRRIRFSFDFCQNNYRSVIRNEQEILVFDSADELVMAPVRTWSEQAFVLSKINGVRQGKYRGKLRELRQDLTPEDLGDIGVPPLKWFGIGFLSGDWNNVRLAREFEEMVEPDLVDGIGNTGRDVFRINKGIRHAVVRSEIDWDAKRMVPVRIAIFRKPNKKFSDEMALLVEKCEWQKIGEFYVPYKGRGKKADWVDVEGHRFIVDYETEFDAHWFSFNEELPPETFDPEQLRSVTTLNELLSEKPLEDDSKKDPAD